MKVKTVQNFKTEWTTKVSDAQQGKMINNFNNARLKFLKTSAAVWFSNICGINQLTPKYVRVCKNSTKNLEWKYHQKNLRRWNF
jgi:hypothetical protein